MLRIKNIKLIILTSSVLLTFSVIINIKFAITIEESTNELKDLISSILYLKNSEYDIVMLDIIWMG